MKLTEGFEFITAFTNLIIVFVSLFIFIKTKNNKWKVFYLLFVCDAILGCIIHGIVMSKLLKKILWIILSGLFTFTINHLLYIFIENKISLKKEIFFSIFIYLVFVIQMIFKIDFLPYFLFYGSVCIIFLLFILFKNFKINKYYIIGLLLQFISGIFLAFKIKLGIFDKNGISHLFIILLLILFYIGNKKKI